MNRNDRPIQILLVEDNPGDIRLTEEALRESKINHVLYVANNGQQGLERLRSTADSADSFRPDLIFLDLNMPLMNGHEFLTIIKQDENLKKIPVVVLTTSGDDDDILETYNLHANCFVTKPVELEQFIKVILEVYHFWFSIVELPKDHQELTAK
ncbi:MAG: response regulator [Chloroflexi bacterium]|nr:response regulator [Chloroflexota bacterium]